MAVVCFLAENNLPARIVSSPTFKALFKRAQTVPTFTVPGRQSLGFEDEKLGKGLQLVVDHYDGKQNVLLKHAPQHGTTTFSDGAKNRGRSALNTCVQLANGAVLMLQHTDATGLTKNKEYLLADAVQALRKLGFENAFLLVMDGASACKWVLMNIHLQAGLGRTLGQRCSMHSCQLVLQDIGKKLFREELVFMVELLKFIVNHEKVHALFKELDPRCALLQAVATRFMTQFMSSETILKDWEPIQSLVSSQRLKDLILATSDMKEPGEEEGLKTKLGKRRLWLHHRVNVSNIIRKKIEFFAKLEKPVALLLRLTDSHLHTLPLVAFYYENAVLETMEVAKEVFKIGKTAGEDNEWAKEYNEAFLSKLQRILCNRHRDVVSDAALAAAYCSPWMMYEKEFTPLNPTQLNHSSEPFDTFVSSGGKTKPSNGGVTAMKKIMHQYYVLSGFYGAEGKKLESAAWKLLDQARCKLNWFGTPEASDSAGEDGASFWAAVLREVEVDVRAVELFVKLSYGRAGQGEAERLNNLIKSIRTPKRNRMHSETTAAYAKVRMALAAQGLASDVNRQAKKLFNPLEAARLRFAHAAKIAAKRVIAAGPFPPAPPAAPPVDVEEADDPDDVLFVGEPDNFDGDPDLEGNGDANEDEDEILAVSGAAAEIVLEDAVAEMQAFAEAAMVPVDEEGERNEEVEEVARRWADAVKGRVRRQKVR